ncbi:MAG: ATP synthase F1 subunit delta [Coxiella sp. RIFCSPHIGHO2_12_FULL_44_14]|nr:MAG: ATP synthase F1 subunit delta [Coxiella sp. RIFCSPHIGHO2_12_FULL_44_14]
MSAFLTIARPYAKALFMQALKNEQLELWTQALQVLSIVVQDPPARALLENPRYTEIQHQALLVELVRAVVGEDAQVLGNQLAAWVGILIQEKRWMLSPEIAILYHQLVMAHQGVVEVTVTSAFPLSQDHRDQFQKVLEKRLRSKVALQFAKDERLMGGAIIQMGNWVMDGSIRGKLIRLAKSLQA